MAIDDIDDGDDAYDDDDDDAYDDDDGDAYDDDDDDDDDDEMDSHHKVNSQVEVYKPSNENLKHPMMKKTTFLWSNTKLFSEYNLQMDLMAKHH